MGKNLLSDTDYTKGRDNRFGVTAVIARVAKIEVSEKGANVRVIMPDRLDHQNQPLISKPIPILQIASKAKRSFAVPRINDNVLCIKLPNGTSNYAVIGAFYTSKEPPPVTDAMLDYVEYDDGSTMKFDASNGEMTWRIKGKIDAQSEKEIIIKSSGDKVTIEGDADVLVKSDSAKVTIDGATDVEVLAADNVNITSALIKLTGAIQLVGNIIHTGNITTSGVHVDVNGLHTGAAELLERIKALETRLQTLEAAVLKGGAS